MLEELKSDEVYKEQRIKFNCVTEANFLGSGNYFNL